MNTNSIDEQMAQGAAAWNERETHENLMRELNTVGVRSEDVVLGDEYGSEYSGTTTTVYHADLADIATLNKIVERGNDEEIARLISRYNLILANPQTKMSGYLPDFVQIALVKRHRQSEIEAVTKLYGFCPEAQKVMFEMWAHQDLVAYTQKHGFCEECQAKMLAKWSHDELFGYALKHSFAKAGEELVLTTWGDREISAYVARHPLTLEGQKMLIKRGRHEEIMSFMRCNELDHRVYLDLLDRGNHEEILLALSVSYSRDMVLPVGFNKLVDRGDHEEILAVMRHMVARDFDADMQHRILARGNESEIVSMVKCGLCKELIDEVLQSYEDGKETLLGSIFASKSVRSMTRQQEERFIKVAPSKEFVSYVASQPLAPELIGMMIEKRSDEDIRFYIGCHLGQQGFKAHDEDALMNKASNDTLFTYYRMLPSWNREDKRFIYKLLKQEPLNHQLLIQIFMSLPSNVGVDEKEVALINGGRREDVLNYCRNTSITLCLKAFITLFFRDLEMFKLYLLGRETYYKS